MAPKQLRALVLCGAALLAWAELRTSGHASYGSTAADVQRGRSIATAKCAACHGIDGNSANPQIPKVAGQREGYLYLQLKAFKAGTRSSTTMSAIAGALSDADLAGVARYYHQQTIRPDSIKNTALANTGRRIFFAPLGGAAMSCATCHGATGPQGTVGGMPMMGMGGMMANVPTLNGQHAAYIVSQLKSFADGRRQGMMMNSIAASLSKTDREAVAAYLSGLP